MATKYDSNYTRNNKYLVMESTRVNNNGFLYKYLEDLSRIYAAEYNNVKIHDRVLVLDIVQNQDEWNEVSMSIVTTDSPAEPMPNQGQGKSTTCDDADEKAGEKWPSSAGIECVFKQNFCGFINSSEFENLSDRKRPLNEEGNLLIMVKRPKEDILNYNTEIQLPIEDAIASDEKAAEMNDGPKLPSQTSILNLSASEIIRQHHIFVHASWLAVHSEYFRSLFYNGMKESTSKEVHIKVPESKEKGHLMMLEAMYRPYILDTATVDELLLVLELADKYSVSFVFRKCIYVLHAMELSLEICEKIIYVVQVKHSMANVSDLVNTIQKFLAEEFSPLDATWMTEKFKTLSEALLRSLLSSNDVTTQFENTVFHALMHWIKTNNHHTSNSDPGPNSSSLLTLVRFELLSIDYLYNVVQHHPIATTMACFPELYLQGISYHALPKGIRKHCPVKPVKRGVLDTFFVQHTWVIQKDQFLEMLDGEAKISSELFWFCGYEMQMSLKKNGSSSNRFDTTIFLETLGLIPSSEVRLFWRFICPMFLQTYMESYTFSKKQEMLAVDVGFKDLVLYQGNSISIGIFMELSIHSAC